jgi:PAS domain S-box-containing protein
MSEFLPSTVLVLVVAMGVVAWVLMRGRKTTRPAETKTNGKDINRMFRSGFERALIGIAYFNAEGAWLDVNPKLLLLLGYSREEFLDTSFRGLTHPEDRKREASFMADLRAAKFGGYTINKRILRNSGEFQSCRTDVVRCADASGAICYQCFVSELDDAQDRSHDVCTAFEDIGDVSVIKMDAAGIVSGWNRGAQLLYGYRAAEMIGKPWARIHAPERHTSRGPTGELEIAARGGVFDGSEKRVRNDGTVITTSVRLIPQYVGRELAGFVEIARDATLTRPAIEYRDAYERLRATSEQRLGSLESENAALRDESARLAQTELLLRTESDALRAANEDLAGKNRVISSALKKTLERRREIELARQREEQKRAESEIDENGLPPGIRWEAFEDGSTMSEVIVGLTQARMTGTLALRSEEKAKRFYFDGGHVVTCASNHPDLLLGDLLVEHGIIDQSQRTRVIEVQSESGMSFGRLLILLGMLSEKIGREIRDLLTWEEGEFAFSEGTAPAPRFLPAKVDLATILANGGMDGPFLEEDHEDTEEAGEEFVSGVADGPFVEPDGIASPGAPRLYIARKKGKSRKYHVSDCIAVRGTPAPLRARFATREVAEANGYIPCAKCIPVEPADAVGSRLVITM